MEHIIKSVIFGLISWSCSLLANADSSLLDRYATSNAALANHIANLPDDIILDEERRMGPKATLILRSLIPIISQKPSGVAIQTYLLQQFKAHDWQPVLVGYQGYPAAVPISIKDGVLNGLPKVTSIPESTLVKVELVAASKQAYVAQAWTFPTEKATKEQLALLAVARKALSNGIKQIRHNAYFDDIGNAIGLVLDANNVQPIIEFCGYSMGKARIQPPEIITYHNNYPTGKRMQTGQVLNIYVVAKLGKRGIRISTENFFEAFTKDGSDSVVLSSMVEVKDNGYKMLTNYVD
ncbi:M24 family metallopeptidase [Pseudomonas sp.]|uniref:M24 family metallopeptidase n=1 Tax=Pseudomonas sp. TaxID=306 RepID=UPI0028969AE4|nr:M24 family metallopeptidase [Pseudomonas sp.]